MNEKIVALRQAMKEVGLDAYIIPSSDPHQSEYVAECWNDRAYMSGFTGSAGTLVVTHDFAGLWTDGRYFIQAEEELAGSGIQLMKLHNQFVPEHLHWLRDHLQPRQAIGFDGRDFSQSQVVQIEKICQEYNLQLSTRFDLVSMVWADRPPMPVDSVFEHELRFAGTSRVEKIQSIRRKMEQDGLHSTLLTALDDIAYTFNLRGRDVAYNPVFIAYAYISAKEAILFLNPEKCPRELKETLAQEGISLRPYESVTEFLNTLSEHEKIAVDPDICNYAMYHAIHAVKVHKSSYPKWMKAIKTSHEIEHIRNAMVKDGVALTHAFKWLEDTLATRGVKETEFAQRIAHYRSQQEGYFGESFAAIIGYQENGAIIHYHPQEDSCKTIHREGILLCDSGGQYLDGTTDITRTIALGDQVDPEHKKAYTLVLKGMIAISKIAFPKGTNGAQLDTLARQFLWNEGMNYGHGTGHGVGYFMNVHEPPQGIAYFSSERGRTVQEVGMLSSNEPGFYRPNGFGIRIENLIVTKESGFDGFLNFETLTYFPLDLRLVDFGRLDVEEQSWIQRYHQEVFDRLAPHLDEVHKAWLAAKIA